MHAWCSLLPLPAFTSPCFPLSSLLLLPLSQKVMVTFTLLLLWLMNLSKPSHLRSVLSKSMRYMKNCNAYSPTLHKGSDLTSSNKCFKNRTNEATKFCPPLPNNALLLIQEPRKLFSIKTISQLAGCGN